MPSLLLDMTEGDHKNYAACHTTLPIFRSFSETHEYTQDCKGADGVAAERGIRLLADVVLHLAGVLLGGLSVHAELHEKLGQRVVPVEHTRGDVHPARRERDEPVAIHGDVAVFAQALGRIGHARLRDAELLCECFCCIISIASR